MTVSANSGPNVSFGITTTSTGQVMQYNEDRGPDVSDLGHGFMDPRPFFRYQPGNTNYSFYTMFGNQAYVDFQPAALSSNGLVSNGSSGLGGTTLTLTATGSALTLVNLNPPEGGPVVSVYCIDSSSAAVAYGQSGQVKAWNPRSGAGRTITIFASSNLDGGTFTVAGRDMYGIKMTETLAAGSTTIAGKKAFKYISSITASTTLTSTGFMIGYTDTFGFPALYSYNGSQNTLVVSSAAQVATTTALTSANSVLGSTVATQTSTTPDVRGTYASTTASNGTLRLQMRQTFDAYQVAQLTNTDNSAIFGGTQFSSV